MSHTFAEKRNNSALFFAFCFHLSLFASDARFPIARFIVYWFLLLLGSTYAQEFMVQIFLLIVHWEQYTGTIFIKVSEIPRRQGQILGTPGILGLKVLKGRVFKV